MIAANVFSHSNTSHRGMVKSASIAIISDSISCNSAGKFAVSVGIRTVPIQSCKLAGAMNSIFISRLDLGKCEI